MDLVTLEREIKPFFANQINNSLISRCDCWLPRPQRLIDRWRVPLAMCTTSTLGQMKWWKKMSSNSKLIAVSPSFCVFKFCFPIYICRVIGMLWWEELIKPDMTMALTPSYAWKRVRFELDTFPSKFKSNYLINKRNSIKSCDA